ncbi:ABC transporter permease [Limobrevibacterium gyesilva]|uniref:ABC transporter permease n=1 Tax=Limobrevibacterium gyesilva TaxID=2991712 RepID=A0AA42CCV7_9PROT|nr:ABC transporter permease [Limobrevibacterium gyesilva]MCW3474048.1 ABC transporter permease [Limobrevibacterium gyesilva]
MSRGAWLVSRLLQMVPTFLLIGLAVFVLARLLPGNAVMALLGDRGSDEAVARLTRQLGLDQSIGMQLLAFLESVLRGQFGTSLAFRIPVTRLIAERLPVTLMLTGMAIVIALALALPLAFVAALKVNRWPDLLIRGVFQVGLSSPIFYVGLVLLTVFAAWLRIFPVGGYGDTFAEHIYHLFLPAVTLAFSLSAIVMRNLRASILSVIRAEYVDFARAKGLRSRVVLLRHVLRNALIATVTLVGLHIGSLLGGAVITETVFAVPGVGRLMVDSIFARDYPVIQALTLVLAVLVSLAFLVTDLVQMWLDPRVGR